MHTHILSIRYVNSLLALKNAGKTSALCLEAILNSEITTQITKILKTWH